MPETSLRVNSIKTDRKERLFFENLSLRDRCIWLIGQDTGLRIGDILRIKKAQIRNGTFTIKEQKTGKTKKCILSQKTIDLCKIYADSVKIPRKHKLFVNPCTMRPYTRQGIYKAFRKAGLLTHIDAIGTHSNRKTAAVKEFKRKGISGVKKLLNHSDTKTSEVYLKNRRVKHEQRTTCRTSDQ